MLQPELRARLGAPPRKQAKDEDEDEDEVVVKDPVVSSSQLL